MNKQFGFTLNHKRLAFTLTEVLIALAVVGVVSAITVPTLMNKSAKKTQAALIHKTYVDFSDAIELYMNDEEKKTVFPILNNLNKVNTFLTQYFRINKNCNSAPSGSCLSVDFKTFNGVAKKSGPYETPKNYSCIQNTAGVTICMTTAKTTKKFEDTASTVWVDTNGTKDPNMKGRDIFSFALRNDGSIDDFNIPLGDAAKRDSNYATGCAAENNDTSGCIGRLINNNWEMD